MAGTAFNPRLRVLRSLRADSIGAGPDNLRQTYPSRVARGSVDATSIEATMARIAFLGLGRMGRGMAGLSKRALHNRRPMTPDDTIPVPEPTSDELAAAQGSRERLLAEVAALPGLPGKTG